MGVLPLRSPASARPTASRDRTAPNPLQCAFAKIAGIRPRCKRIPKWRRCRRHKAGDHDRIIRNDSCLDKIFDCRSEKMPMSRRVRPSRFRSPSSPGAGLAHAHYRSNLARSRREDVLNPGQRLASLPIPQRSLGPNRSSRLDWPRPKAKSRGSRI